MRISTFSTSARVAAAALVVAIGSGGAVGLAAPAAARPAPIDRLTRLARQTWAVEAGGTVAHTTLRRVAADPTLRRLLASGNRAAAGVAGARLPGRGTATLHGLRYQVRTFRVTALGGEPVDVSILKRA